MARPSKYKEDFARQAEAHCSLGATNADLAVLFDVCETTIYTWIASKPEFLGAVKKGRATADRRIIESLHGRALGGIQKVETVKVLKDADGNQQAVVVPHAVYIPPDTTAAIFWLKNRRPADWRDVQERKHSGEINHTHEQVVNDADAFRSRFVADIAARGSKEGAGKPH